MIDLMIGQIWKEMDVRVEREVKIVGITLDQIRIQNIKTGRITEAMASRFNGRLHGYRFVSGPGGNKE